MMIAIDIETIPNPDTFKFLPEPECTDSRIKDPAKIAAHIEAKRVKQRDGAALDPMTGRVCCWAGVADETETVETLEAQTDEAERTLIQSLMSVFGGEETRLITFNGIGFDLPFIYKRAIILGVDPGSFDAPPLSAWTKRYTADRHYDLMKIWDGWQSGTFSKLDTVAGVVLGERKIDIDFATFPALLETKEGRAKIGEYCLMDTRLTYKLWQRFNGVLFA